MRNEKDHCVIETTEDFSGWDVLLLERFKPGVCLVHLRGGRHTPGPKTFLVVYCDDSLLPVHWKRPGGKTGLVHKAMFDQVMKERDEARARAEEAEMLREADASRWEDQQLRAEKAEAKLERLSEWLLSNGMDGADDGTE